MMSSTGSAGGLHPSRRSVLLSALSASVSALPWPALAADGGALQPYPAAEFLGSVGIGIHLGQRETPYYAKFEAVIELLQDLGIRQLRDVAMYSTGITREHEFYQRVRRLVGMGYRFDLVCTDALNPYIFCPPRRLPEIYDWCGGGVDIIEGANEPDLSKRPGANPAVSSDHQRTLYAVVKGTPSLRNVIVASPSYIQKSVPLAEDISDAVDWINLHPYPGMEHPETGGPGALTGFIPAAQRICGKKPVLVSETGYHTAVQTTKAHLPVSEAIKTRYLARLLLWDFKNGVRRSYLYELMDSFNNGPTDPESHFGLAGFDGARKPCFLMIKQFLALFGPPAATAAARPGGPFRFEISGNSQDLQSAVFRRGDGSHLLFLWLGISGWDRVARMPRPPVSRELVLTLQPSPRAARARLFGDDGSLGSAPLTATDGRFKIMVSDQLTAIEVDA